MDRTVEIVTGPQPTGSVIWLHGLGADGNDFAPLVPELLRLRPLPALRFVFPHAPLRPVTINNGYVMRAWYDVLSFDRGSQQDDAGIRASAASIETLLEREHERGIANDRIVLAGFSQGGAMALHAGVRQRQPLAGLMLLSCYLVQAERLASEHTPASLKTPVFMAHGRFDPVLGLADGQRARAALQAAGYQVQWHEYDMPHSVCPEEVGHIADFLAEVLGVAAGG